MQILLIPWTFLNPVCCSIQSKKARQIGRPFLIFGCCCILLLQGRAVPETKDKPPVFSEILLYYWRVTKVWMPELGTAQHFFSFFKDYNHFSVACGLLNHSKAENFMFDQRTGNILAVHCIASGLDAVFSGT